MDNQMRIILASSSPRRRELLQSLGLAFEVNASNVDETTEPGLGPVEVVEQLSLRKAQAVAKGIVDAVIIGSDTIVVLDEDILGKPNDEQDAFGMLERLQGRSHHVYSGVTCIDTGMNKTLTSHRKTRVHMKPLSHDLIQRYIATGEPMDKAGSYAIQGIGATLIESIEGCYFNVVGLPLFLLSEQLEQFQIRIL